MSARRGKYKTDGEMLRLTHDAQGRWLVGIVADSATGQLRIFDAYTDPRAAAVHAADVRQWHPTVSVFDRCTLRAEFFLIPATVEP